MTSKRARLHRFGRDEAIFEYLLVCRELFYGHELINMIMGLNTNQIAQIVREGDLKHPTHSQSSRMNEEFRELAHTIHIDAKCKMSPHASNTHITVHQIDDLRNIVASVTRSTIAL